MQVKSTPPASGLRPWQTGAWLLALALACYWPALRGGQVWDDQAHVTRPDLRSLAGLGRIWTDLYATQQFYPLLHSAFWVEHRLWGDAMLGYHLVNVLLHATAAGLLIMVLRRLRIPGAALAGFIFVAHPVCVESVAWISEQKNTLSLVFYLLAALAYLRFEDGRRVERVVPNALIRPATSSSALGTARSTLCYFIASSLFLCALLTKTITATLPAALLVVFWWQRGRLSWRRDVLPLLPWFVVAAASGIFTAWVERTLIGAEGAEFALTPAQRCLLAGRVIWFYLGKLFWPTHLVFFYPHWSVSADAGGWIGYLAAALAVTAALWLCRRRARGPLAAWLFFVGSLFPALGFLNVYPFRFSYVADHFQYLASLGVITAVSAGLAQLLARAAPGRRAAGWGACGVLVASLGLLSRAQSATYGDVQTLYAATLAGNPDCWMAHYNLAILLAGDNRLAEANDHFRAAVKLKPDYWEAMVNWGDLLFQAGDFQGAYDKYQDSLRINPDAIEAHNSLGLLFAKTGHGGEAIAQYGEALRLDPNFARGHFNLANALRGAGRIPEAIEHYETALRLFPNYADAEMNLGVVLLQQGSLPEAIARLENTLRMRPDYADAHNNLGLALARSGRLPEAIAHYEEALRLKPDYVAAHANYGSALRQLGRAEEADAQFALAARLGGHP